MRTFEDLPSNLRNPTQMKDSDFLQILAKYKFVLAIENAVCPDYITEKLWKVLQVGAVPVYFGAPNVQVCVLVRGHREGRPTAC